MVSAQLIGIQFLGCEDPSPTTALTKDEALAVAERLVAHARQPGADLEALAKRWSDLPVRTYKLVKAQNDPSLAPVYALQPGQVSDPVLTPYGVMIAWIPAK